MKLSNKQIAQKIVNQFHDQTTAKELMKSLKRDIRLSRNAAINVAVNRGTATLSGRVLDWTEYQVAYELARTNVGVTSVDLKLFVKRPRLKDEIMEKEYKSVKQLANQLI